MIEIPLKVTWRTPSGQHETVTVVTDLEDWMLWEEYAVPRRLMGSVDRPTMTLRGLTRLAFTALRRAGKVDRYETFIQRLVSVEADEQQAEPVDPTRPVPGTG